MNASAEEVEALVDVEVAADNSMNGCAIAGAVDAVDVAIEALTEKGFKTKKLRAATGYHSRCVDGCLEDIPTMAFQPSACAVYSTVTGARLSGEGADYWRRQLRSKVRFTGSPERLTRVFLEASDNSGSGLRAAFESPRRR